MVEENTEATAESPAAMTDEERQNLAELKAKEAEEAKAAAEQAAAEAAEEAAEEAERVANRPLFHVLVRHMARSPRTRTMRAARAGHRRQGVLLDDGTRIRKRGRRRFTEVDLRELANNNQKLLEYVRIGALEVCDPKTEQSIPYEGLLKMIDSVASWVAEKSYSEAMDEYSKAMEAWEAACEAERAAAEEEEREPVLPPEPEEPEKPEAVAVVESGLQDDPVLGSTAENAAPEGDPDATHPDMGEGAALAAVDQHEAEMMGEANEPPGDTGLLEDNGSDAGDSEEDAEGEEEGEGEGEENGLTEDQLLAMKLDELKTLAVESYGCDEEAVSKMRAKKEVVASIFEASAEGEE